MSRVIGTQCSGLTHKSAPIVALYWLLNLLFTYWFIRDVFPTLGVQGESEFLHDAGC